MGYFDKTLISLRVIVGKSMCGDKLTRSEIELFYQYSKTDFFLSKDEIKLIKKNIEEHKE
jgi:hypothetical protein|nr:MAG TPA: calcium binding domain protein [Ackermannviridae sp.]DAP06204.1 MAG TPA: S-100/ICaBP type calcium binding domain protein [Ackermannviridae sp.]DAW82302.1 MAG TPA: S-100/ICaBP type calcium binding domain protein [Bacteriophage sp.]